ncbi:af291909_2recq family helicase [Fusarium napiforme]|uniref:Af291909_2recq family helicase n=1 Tax=Fusarium napiforme TaxID=42672 RepID=A0A8H5K8C5_9HYPO|nr:af291909_2recq family helicase [Fusarium napiforme]
MDDVSTTATDWLIYNDQYKTLICRQHGYAVTCLAGHLKAKHPYLDRRARQELISRHEGTPLLLPGPNEMLKHGPDNPSEPVEGLTIHRGWACTYPFCRYKTASWKTMRVHVNREHNMKGKRALQEWTAPAQLQTFLAGPKYAVSYFCVQTTSAGDRARANTTLADKGDIVTSITELWSEQRQEQEQLRLRLDAGMPKHETSNWLNRTGWPTHLEGKVLEKIYEASKKPSSGQDAMLERLVVETHELIVTRCVGGLSSMPLMIRSHLASPHNNDMDSRPFGRLQEASSMARYVGYIQRFLCYCLTVPFDDQFDLLDTHNFRFTPKQVTALCQLEEHLEDDECPSEVVQEQILQVLASFWMQQLPGSPFDSPLWHFVSVLAIDPDTWQFRTADRFTYVLAGLMYCARATMAEYILPAAQRATMDDLHERFMAARAKWLCKGTITPMGYMLSLHLYGRKIARETGSRLRVTWSEDGQRMHYLGQPLAMEDIRNMVASMTADAEELLWEQLMFKEGGLDARFPIPLDELQDDMTLSTIKRRFIINRPPKWRISLKF